MIQIDKIKHIENADGVREKINSNFEKLAKTSSSQILSLTTKERESIDGAYFRDGLIVYDITQNKWYKRNKNTWDEHFLKKEFIKTFTSQEWNNGEFHLPYSEHKCSVQNVSVYMFLDNKYISVTIDVHIKGNHDITLISDLAFTGKVIIS